MFLLSPKWTMRKIASNSQLTESARHQCILEMSSLNTGYSRYEQLCGRLCSHSRSLVYHWHITKSKAKFLKYFFASFLHLFYVKGYSMLDILHPKSTKVTNNKSIIATLIPINTHKCWENTQKVCSQGEGCHRIDFHRMNKGKVLRYSLITLWRDHRNYEWVNCEPHMNEPRGWCSIKFQREALDRWLRDTRGTRVDKTVCFH